MNKMRKIAYTMMMIAIVLSIYSCSSTTKKEEPSPRFRVGLTTIFTDDIDGMKSLFHDKMGIPITSELADFIEFKTGQSRFSIGSREAMFKTLKDSTYIIQRSGASVGIGFMFDTKEEVDSLFRSMKAQGVFFNQAPKMMPWNEYTAFFKDPEGNIHELIYTPPQD
ncbi:VOC family protein [Halosquirtibacter xylanolyticus]|uniref:VOC family protein n=1 Tax=Halosquirtibacter xylanolyticus TaxID=3374599 RepID=UPI003747B9C7|nr:VOC family protein [Prolixibacteraceae bacterium]